MGNHYKADGEAEIGELFEREGDSLAKAGFTEPDLSHPPEERLKKVEPDTSQFPKGDLGSAVLLFQADDGSLAILKTPVDGPLEIRNL